jgi:D-sedoheptulose 7-phosphate isomerase
LSATEYTRRYLAEIEKIAAGIDPVRIDRIARLLREIRERGGRVFFLGTGGGAGHASHATSDFRKIAGIECYCPSDNVSELTARVNDEGWETSYSNWLRGSRLCSKDALFLFSVGGGNLTRNISANLVRSLQLAKETGATIIGIVGRDGGFTAEVGDEVIVVPTISTDTVTAHTETFQAAIWHCIVTHPELRLHAMKWESET